MNYIARGKNMSRMIILNIQYEFITFQWSKKRSVEIEIENRFDVMLRGAPWCMLCIFCIEWAKMLTVVISWRCRVREKEGKFMHIKCPMLEDSFSLLHSSIEYVYIQVSIIEFAFRGVFYMAQMLFSLSFKVLYIFSP